MSNGNFNSLQFFPLNFDHRWSITITQHAILAVKKRRTFYLFSARNTSRTLCLGSLCAKRRHLDMFFDYNYATQMRHVAFSILPPFSILFEFSVHSASV